MVHKADSRHGGQKRSRILKRAAVVGAFLGGGILGAVIDNYLIPPEPLRDRIEMVERYSERPDGSPPRDGGSRPQPKRARARKRANVDREQNETRKIGENEVHKRRPDMTDSCTEGNLDLQKKREIIEEVNTIIKRRSKRRMIQNKTDRVFGGYLEGVTLILQVGEKGVRVLNAYTITHNCDNCVDVTKLVRRIIPDYRRIQIGTRSGSCRFPVTVTYGREDESS